MKTLFFVCFFFYFSRFVTAGLEKIPRIFISRLVSGGLAESTGLVKPANHRTVAPVRRGSFSRNSQLSSGSQQLNTTAGKIKETFRFYSKCICDWRVNNNNSNNNFSNLILAIKQPFSNSLNQVKCLNMRWSI
jgi:hypothetical protein